MTCKEVLEKLKEELKIKKIEVVEKYWITKHVNGFCNVLPDSLLCCQIVLEIPYLDSEKYMRNLQKTKRESNAIWLGNGPEGKAPFVEKVIVLFHEMGHVNNEQQKTFDERIKRNTAFQYMRKNRYCEWQRKLIVQDEKDAWDEGWKMVIKFGLNKNRSFEKKFLKIKTERLASYKVPLANICV